MVDSMVPQHWKRDLLPTQSQTRRPHTATTPASVGPACGRSFDSLLAGSFNSATVTVPLRRGQETTPLCPSRLSF